MSESRQLEKRFGSGWYNKLPVQLVKGRGAEVWDVEGRKYIDCIGGHGVVNAGHCPPRVVEALQDQVARLINCHSSIVHEQRARLQATLARVTPSHLTRSFLCNSGAEAVECALKVALGKHRATRAPEIISFKRAFHGRTMGALATTYGPAYRKPFRGFLPAGVRFASYGDIDDVRAQITENSVAVIVEMVQGEGGVYPAPPGFPEALQELCRAHDLTLIVDEVQTGFGRTGKLFAFEHYDVQPDLVCVAKSIAAGIPMGAVIGTAETMAGLKRKEHASTFGGSPVACAAANATLETIEADGLVENAERVGQYMTDAFAALQETPGYETIKEVRGLGLMLGIQCRDRVGGYLRGAFERGVLGLTAGISTIRLLPPLCLSQAQAEQVVAVFRDVLQAE